MADYRRHFDEGRRHERDWSDRANDEVRSWFGDDKARQRRGNDERDDRFPYGGDRGSRHEEWRALPVVVVTASLLAACSRASSSSAASTSHGSRRAETGRRREGSRYANFAASAGIRCTVGSNLELGIGSAAMIHFALSAPAIDAGVSLPGVTSDRHGVPRPVTIAIP